MDNIKLTKSFERIKNNIEKNCSEEPETEGFYKACYKKYLEYQELVDQYKLENWQLTENIKMLLTLLRQEREKEKIIIHDDELPF